MKMYMLVAKLLNRTNVEFKANWTLKLTILSKHSFVIAEFVERTIYKRLMQLIKESL